MRVIEETAEPVQKPFVPFRLTIELATPEDAAKMYAIFNYTPITEGANVNSEKYGFSADVRELIGRKVCDQISSDAWSELKSNAFDRLDKFVASWFNK